MLFVLFWVVLSGDDKDDSATAPTTTFTPEWVDEGFVLGEVEPCRSPEPTEREMVGFPISTERLPAKGNVHVAVLFVDFPDANAQSGQGDTAGEYNPTTEDAFFSEISEAEAYLEAMSYGALNLTFWPLHEWLRMSDTHSSYSDEKHALVAEAIALADHEFAFERIDSVVVVTDPRAESLHPSSAPLWGGSGSFGEYGQTILQNSVLLIPLEPDQAGWGGSATAHELGHNFGLPDLYDTNVEPDSDGYGTPDGMRFVGNFDIMGAGSYEKFTSNEMFAWSRWQLGWIHDAQIACIGSFPASVQIAPVAASAGTKAAVVPLTETTALVVESRRRLGYDLDLQGEGALVYTVDSTVESGDGPIVVRGTSLDDWPDASVLLEAGETLTVDGYTVTVEEATPEADFIKISAP